MLTEAHEFLGGSQGEHDMQHLILLTVHEDIA